jgi:DNA-binding response OmpR family regulator
MYSIAVLDDDDNLTESLVGALKSYGFDATGFVTAERLLVSNAAKPFDAVVSDWYLGYEPQADTFYQLRTTPGFGAKPIVVLTGWAEGSEQHEQLRDIARSLHLAIRAKPCATKHLANDLLALIEKRQTYDQLPRH